MAEWNEIYSVMRTIPLVGYLVLLLISLLIDYYIFRDIRTYVSPRHRKPCVVLYGVFTAVCLAILGTTAFVPVANAGENITVLMWLAYTYASIYIPKSIYVLFSAVGRLFAAKRRGVKVNYGAMCGFPAALLVCIAMWWGVLFTRHEIKAERLTLVSTNLPEAFDGYRIVQFSDAHVGSWGSDTSFVSALVDSINSFAPDLIVFTGDIVNRETAEMKPFLDILRRLRARDGVYSVLGNHDYGDYKTWSNPSERDSNNELLATWQCRMGWRLMNNTHEFISRGNDSIVLIGVENWGEPPFHQYGNLASAYGNGRDSSFGLMDDRFKILLSHNPEHWRQEVRNVSNIDLTLSGHTHAMQMMLSLGGWKWSPAVWRYPNWGGMYGGVANDGRPIKLYVNIGCGEVGIPARFGSAYPEITEITLRSRNIQ